MTPRRRLERLERKVLAKLPGDTRACYLLDRLLRRGPLTALDVEYLRHLVPTDPAERCKYISVMVACTTELGLDCGWTEEDILGEAGCRLMTRWYLVCNLPHTDNESPTELPPWEAEPAWEAYQRWWHTEAAMGRQYPWLSHDTFCRWYPGELDTLRRHVEGAYRTRAAQQASPA